MNAIAMFILSGLIGRLMGIFKVQGSIFRTVFAPLSSNPYNASLYYAVAFVLVLYLCLLAVVPPRLVPAALA